MGLLGPHPPRGMAPRMAPPEAAELMNEFAFLNVKSANGNGLQPNSDVRQPRSDGLQPRVNVKCRSLRKCPIQVQAEPLSRLVDALTFCWLGHAWA